MWAISVCRIIRVCVIELIARSSYDGLMRFVCLFAVFLTFVSVHAAAAQGILNRDDLLTVFKEHSAIGTFTLLDIASGQMTVVGVKRAEKRYIPASTFKIINGLIALETGAIIDENEVVPFGGKPHPIKAWERDMSIRDGIRISNVPIFQEIARRVGLERYSKFLMRFGFGNEMVGNNVETFWLNGPLKISAIEYPPLLAKLAKRELPADKGNQAILRDIIRLETNGDATLYGKTGWTITPDPDIGWFVGWVERNGRISTFALNIDILNRSYAKKRKLIAKALLSALGVY